MSSDYQLIPTPPPLLVLLEDLDGLTRSVQHYLHKGNDTAAMQASQDALGVLQEIRARFTSPAYANA